MIIQPIQILDSQTAEKIAAGEVIEHPASVVKELLENSLDAGANRIEIAVQEGGKRRIEVVDNGNGIDPAGLELVFCRFATSKLTTLGDLDDLTSLGFRGEALPSIAAVSRITLTSRRSKDLCAWRLRREGGKGGPPVEIGAPKGTAVVVEDLFFNTPGRLKFLRGAPRELARISTLVTSLALAHPGCAFTLSSEKRTVLRTAGDGSLRHTVGALYGNEAAVALLPLQRVDSDVGISLTGFLSAPYYSRASRRWITVVINGRTVWCPPLVGALERAYGGMLGRRRHPLAVLVLEVPPALLDINVHPAKNEIRFERPERFNELVFRAARAALQSSSLTKTGFPWKKKGRAGWQEQGRFQQKLLLQPPPHRPDSFWADPVGSVSPVSPELDQSLSQAERGAAVGFESGTAGYGAECEGCRLIGQFLYSYLVAQKGEELLLIDQHAAHERVLYHALITAKPEQRSSQLTIPLPLELAPSCRERFAEIKPFLEEAGFKVEPFGDNSYIIRAVPFTIRAGPDNEIHALLEQLYQGEPAPGEDNRERILKTVACHRAVKARQPLTHSEAEQLLQDWEQTPGAAYCPHGRPTVLRFHREELNKGFHRREGRR